MAQVNMSLRIDAELKDAFMAAAKSMDRNGSQLIWDFMRQTEIIYKADCLYYRKTFYNYRNNISDLTEEII